MCKKEITTFPVVSGGLTCTGNTVHSRSSGLLQSHSDIGGDGPVKEKFQSLLSSVIYLIWQTLRKYRIQHCTQGESLVSSILL